jgi:pre-mRNA-splicing factor SYF1
MSSPTPTVEALADQLASLTFPVPSPTALPDLLDPKDVTREEDLLRNQSSFRQWWTTIQTAKDEFRTAQRAERIDVPDEVSALLGPLASPTARRALQRLTYLYESALRQFPGSFKLWKSYLLTRMSFVCGKLASKKKSGGRKKLPSMKDALEEEAEDLEEWSGGLDGVTGFSEWASLVATFERALMWVPKVSPPGPSRRFRKAHSRLDAAHMAALPLHLLSPPLSCRYRALARPPHVRPRAAHASALVAPPYLGPLPAVG